MKRLAIIGAGDLGQQIAHHVITDNQYEVVGFIDDYRDAGTTVGDIQVLGKIDDVVDLFRTGKFDCVLIAIGYKHMYFRATLFEKFRKVVPFATFVHSACIVDKTALIKEGTVLFPGCIIDQHVTIGENVLLNIGNCIAHDTQIGAHSFLSPCVTIAGFVKIGMCNIIGINTTIIDNIKTEASVQIGGGGVVIKSIDTPGLYVGNPVRFIR